MDRPIAELRNLGDASARMLESVGITTESELAEIGPVEAFVRVRDARGEAPSLNLLWALHGALADLDWRDVPPEERDRLREELGERPKPLA